MKIEASYFVFISLILGFLQRVCVKRHRLQLALELTKQYRTVKLPSKMVQSIELLIKDHPELGYSSTADFVKDAVRLHYCWRNYGIKCDKE